MGAEDAPPNIMPFAATFTANSESKQKSTALCMWKDSERFEQVYKDGDGIHNVGNKVNEIVMT